MKPERTWRGVAVENGKYKYRFTAFCLGKTHRALPTTAFTASNLILTTLSAMRDRLSPLLHLLILQHLCHLLAVLTHAEQFLLLLDDVFVQVALDLWVENIRLLTHL